MTFANFKKAGDKHKQMLKRDSRIRILVNFGSIPGRHKGEYNWVVSEKDLVSWQVLDRPDRRFDRNSNYFSRH